MLSRLDDTICALATPPGTGGIGVIRVSGPAAFVVTDRISRNPHRVCCRDWPGHTLHRAVILEAQGEIIDDVLLGIFHGPHSYTGEDVVEISGHGGPVPLRRLLSRLLESGVRLAEPGEFSRRAFLNGKMDLAQAEAVGDVIAAQTEEAHRLARRQGEGRLSAAVLQIRETLLGVLARIEGSIDFPEEVGELDSAFCERELQSAAQKISDLLATADRGILYREGLRLVLAGRPNVGKSSLLNALLRTARAIVTPIPGTTRDTIEETLNLRGIPLRAVDTAGLRETDDEVEKIGVARTRETIAAADFVLLVLDATAGETAEDSTLRADLADRPHLVVWNKWDLVKDGPHSAEALTRPSPKLGEGRDRTAPSEPSPVLGRGQGEGLPGECLPGECLPGECLPGECLPMTISAATGWNIEALEAMIVERILGGLPAPTETHTAVVTHARHRQALEAARAHLAEAAQTLRAEMPADFLAIDLQAALTALGQITGQTTPDDVIAEIFARFCIGK